MIGYPRIVKDPNPVLCVSGPSMALALTQLSESSGPIEQSEMDLDEMCGPAASCVSPSPVSPFPPSSPSLLLRISES